MSILEIMLPIYLLDRVFLLSPLVTVAVFLSTLAKIGPVERILGTNLPTRAWYS